MIGNQETMQGPVLAAVVLALLLLEMPNCRAAAGTTDVRLPSVFGDHMIIQRDRPIPVWGTASPGSRLRVELADASVEASARPDGCWSTTLPAMAAGGPHRLKVVPIGEGTTMEFSDVLIGDLWICSGQSNIERPVTSEKDPAATLAAAERPRIRLFQVKPALATTPQTDLNGRWEVCSPATIGPHSAIGYHFSRILQEKLGGVPIGMIQSAWSGRGAECFMAREWLEADPRLMPVLAVTDRAAAEFPRRLAAWAAGGRLGERPRLPQSRPPFIHNAMIAPLTRSPIRGVIWYQGESNIQRADQYKRMLPALIRGWRDAWDQGDFPFLLVQIANYELRPPEAPFASTVAELREAQLTALQLPQTAVIVSADLGEGNDVHPRGRKGIHFHQEVAARLAAAALGLAYDWEVEHTFPSYRSMSIEGNTIRLGFHTKPGELALKAGGEGFAVAGADRQFFPATARLDGDSVRLTSSQVPAPLAVRYGWAANPKLSLFNQSGLPVVPFRTDDWPGLTAGHDHVEKDDPAL